MRLLWTYELPDQGEDSPGSGEAPLLFSGHAVLFAVHRYQHDRENRAQDPSKRGYRFDIHQVTASGEGTVASFCAPTALIPQSWSFLRLADDVVLHVGSFHALPGGSHIAELPFVDACDGAGRGVFLQHDDHLVFADSRKPKVYCHDVRTKAALWMLELPSKQRHRIAPLAVQRGQLVCHGGDALNYIDLATGTVERLQTLPRIDKLYPPTEYEGDLLFPYTNWTSGGLLRFDPRRNKVMWKFTKRGGTAPPRGGPLPVVAKTAIISINDGSSLVGIDLDSGKARWTVRAQWLYTPVEVCGTSIIFGTSGGHGRHLRRHDIETGETEWAVQMDGGCTYYARQGEHLVAGDWSGVLRRVRRTDGEVTDELALGAHLTGPPLVVGPRIYVLRWPTDGAPPSLIALDA